MGEFLVTALLAFLGGGWAGHALAARGRRRAAIWLNLALLALFLLTLLAPYQGGRTLEILGQLYLGVSMLFPALLGAFLGMLIGWARNPQVRDGN